MKTGLRVAALVVVVVVGLGAFIAVSQSGNDSNPTHWDGRVAPIAAAAAKIRRLDFDHPVPVHFLAPKAFRKRVGSVGKSTKAQERELARATAQLRALGLVSGNPDLRKAAAQAQGASALAFYDPDAKAVFVRGTGPLDAAHRVTLAHELTHVLQDQHFDLNGLEDRTGRARDESSDALRTLIEGDAVRVEDSYRAKLSKADRASAKRSDAQDTKRAKDGTASVPTIIQVELSAPYVFGPLVLQMLTARDGNAEVNRAFRRPPFTQRLFVDPSVAFGKQHVVAVPNPKAGRGEHTVGKSDPFGAFDLYLMLAARIDPVDAISAARGWRGGRIVSVKGAGGECARVAIAGADPKATAEMTKQLRAWSATFPNGAVTVTPGRTVAFKACDPGKSSGGASPDPAIERALSVLELHSELEAGLASSGASAEQAGCAALALTGSPQLRALLERPVESVTEPEVSNALEAAAPAARAACK